MGFTNNKYVAKLVNGGAPPPFPKVPSQDPAASTAQQAPVPEEPSHPPLPPGWVHQWDPSTQRWFFFEPATGRTQWVPPSDTARISTATDSGAQDTAHDGFPQQLPARDNRVYNAHKYLNLPTASERAEMMRKAEAEREKKGSREDKNPSFGRKLLRYPGQAVEFAMRGGG
ncbi:hypothetical protein BKA63DRAFT_501160 [Paraphoma chrysanthemicola]|nr:hypothetical protein BKA63DRAFT_501160 [Paraphoma chrysanthemicola]